MSEINSGKDKVDIYNPKEWFLGTWPHEVEEGGWFFKQKWKQFPKTCSNLGMESCICICKEDSAESCDNSGICLDNKGFLVEGYSIKIEEPPITLNIDQTSKKITLLTEKSGGGFGGGGGGGF